MGLELDDDDKSFELILADKRHKELVLSLNGVASALGNNSNSEIVLAIEKQQEKLSALVLNLKKEEKPTELIFNNENLVSSIDIMTNSIIKSLDEIKKMVVKEEKPCEWEFKVKRNGYSDLIETVSVTKKQQ